MKQDLVLVFWHEESQMEVQVVQEVQPPSTGLNTLVHSVHVVSETNFGSILTSADITCKFLGFMHILYV